MGKGSAWVVLLGPALAVAGCQSPFSREDGDEVLRRRVAGAVERELGDAADDHRLLVTTQPDSIVAQEPSLLDRADELETIGPRVPFPEGQLDIGPDLTGGRQQEVKVNLQSAIETAVRNNLSIQFARLQPAIGEAGVVAAEAAFDAVFFTTVDLASTDQPAVLPVINGLPVGSPFTRNEQLNFETGVRKPLTSGGSVFVSTGFTGFNNRDPVLTLDPDPSWASNIGLGIDQPLLRGFGANVNTAAIRLSRNLERASIEQLKIELLLLLESVEAAYWNLRFAWQDLAIGEWLVEVGIQVRDVMERRRDFDTKLAQYSDAVATVEARKAGVVTARRAVRAASDQLKLLLNDPQISIGNEALLVPADRMVEAPIRYNLREAVVTGIANRPEVEQSILGVNDAGIRQMLADNNRLPLLNVSAEMGFFGLDGDLGDSYGNLFDGDFLSWLVGAVFEWPIGNRAAEAGYRQSRLERSQAVINYQLAVQNVVFDVKDALRDCITNYELIQANRSSRIAAAENLRALLVEEETLAALTPEFLNLKFQRQDRLAESQRREILARADYNTSIAGLYRAMGIGLEMNRIELDVIDPDEGDAPAEPKPAG